MGVAVFWGAFGASALLVGALLAYLAKPGREVVALVMALGSGLLIGSVSFELVDEALKTAEVAQVGLATLVGAIVFTLEAWDVNCQQHIIARYSEPEIAPAVDRLGQRIRELEEEVARLKAGG